jgi:hypothetical protein
MPSYILLYLRIEREMTYSGAPCLVHISGNQTITLAPSVRSTSGVAKWIPYEASEASMMTQNCRGVVPRAGKKGNKHKDTKINDYEQGYGTP